MRRAVAAARLALNTVLVAAATLNLARLGPLAQPGRWLDFDLLYNADRYGLRHGWSHVYDPSYALVASHPAGLYHGLYPVFSPPPALWIVAPLALLPQTVAEYVWGAVLAGAIAGAYAAIAPRGGGNRYNYALAVLGLYTIAFTVYIGQITAFVVLGVALACWLLHRGSDVAAGVALTLGLVKPQLIVLIPLALLVGGRPRAFASFVAASAVVGLGMVAMLSPAGALHYVGWVVSNGQGQGIRSEEHTSE